MMTSDISPLKSVSNFAQFVSYLQLFGSMLIIVLLVFVVLTSIREKYKTDLENIVSELSYASKSLGEFLEANYELTIAGVEALLLKYSPSITRICLKLRHGESRSKEIERSVLAVTAQPHEQMPQTSNPPNPIETNE